MMTASIDAKSTRGAQALERRFDQERRVAKQRRARDEVQYLTMIRLRARDEALGQEPRKE